MLNDTKKELMEQARRLVRPYEHYTIDELADAYCDAVDNRDEGLKNIYISALILRFWYTIDKMYKSNTVAPCLEYEDFFEWLYEAIEYACNYRGWRNPEKNLNAQQCINKCIDTIKLQKYYNLRLDKNKTENHCCSMETPVAGKEPGTSKTIGELLEAEETYDDHSADDVISLIQSYIDDNKIIEAILLDNIAFNDVNKYYKKTIKTKNFSGEDYKYTEYSSEFWPFRLIQLLNRLPETYKISFMKRYDISEEKLSTVLSVIDKAPNTKLYKYLYNCLAELKESYVY